VKGFALFVLEAVKCCVNDERCIDESDNKVIVDG
jgi:hypothetical protein